MFRINFHCKRFFCKAVKWAVLGMIPIASLTSCDFWSKKKCEWYITPDLDRRSLAKPGWATVCLKNYRLGKQKCYMTIRIETAESLINKPIRYADMDVDETTMPRVIHSAKACQN
ncbi:MAG: hypothetical protein R3B45_12080 [Bdellovibrionota bacterium]